MKNLPKKIYLQIGGSDVTIDKSTTDWNDLFHGAITWADHRIYDNDIEFILSDVVGRSKQLCECKCEYPIIRTGVTEYCSICQLEVK